MAWFRRKHPAPIEYHCLGCDACYTAATIDAIGAIRRNHQCAGCANTNITGVITVNGEVSPETAAAIRQAWQATLN